MPCRAPSTFGLDKTVALQDSSHGPRRGKRPRWVATHEVSDELLWAPTRVLRATGDEEHLRLGRRLMGTALRRAGLVDETIEAFILEAPEPFVAGLAAEAEALA